MRQIGRGVIPVRRGDVYAARERAYREIWDATHGKLRLYIQSRIENPADAEDLASQVYLIAWEKLEQLQACADPMPWLLKTAQYVIGNYYQQQKTLKKHVISLEELSQEPYREEETFDLAESGPADIKPEDYRLFLLVAVQNHDIKAVAEAYHLSVSACYKRIERTRQRLILFFQKN